MAPLTMETMEAKRSSKLIMSILFVLFGILLLVFQKDGIAAIALILGIALLITAVVYFIQYMRSNRVERSKLVACIVALVFGILFFIFRVQVAYYVVPILIAIAIIVLAIMCIVTAVGYKKLDIPVWWMPLVGAVISIVVAILIFGNLQSTSSVVAIIIGLFLLVFGVLNLLELGTMASLRKRL